jgi:hypothetical protein
MTILILSDHPALNETSGPFTNGLWKYFKGKLRSVGIHPEECIWMNCVNKPAASFYSLTQESKSGALPSFPQLARKAWLRAEHGRDLENLYSTIRRVKPSLVLACGELALLALTHQNKLKFARGRITTALPSCNNVKVLPILHPRAILSEIKQEPILLMDLLKAKREAAFPEVKRPQRFIHLHPSIEDLEDFWNTYIIPSSNLSMDIETKTPMITCVGVAPSPDRAIVVPFYDPDKPGGNYWATPREEKIAWKFIFRCLNTPGTEVFGQNFSYDAQYLWGKMGIPVTQWANDTMVMHHALQIEMEKGLGFLASIYSDELAWKFMAKRRAADRSNKKEDE